jgi:hypothetical protein
MILQPLDVLRLINVHALASGSGPPVLTMHALQSGSVNHFNRSIQICTGDDPDARRFLE